MSKGVRKLLGMSIALVALFGMLLISSEAMAYANSVTYSGQGLIADGFGGYDLVTELCDGNTNGILENGADAEGPYLLFVLTATGAKNADITFNATAGNAGTYAMTKFGNGTFKYVSPWLSPSTLPGNVTATYDGKVKNAQLVISHGCRPFEEGGAWCSPGFWGRAQQGAWNLVAPITQTSLFNSTVYDSFYGATFVADPTLITVLTTTGGTYKGPGVAGTDPRTDPAQGGVALNAFNATGAYLTDLIPGYAYDPGLLNADEDESDTCPIDHFGTFKDAE
jgi:hypothetical protein